MKATQLRLGNIIKDIMGDRPCEVIGIKLGAIRVNLEVVRGHFVTDNESEFLGIPLTDEWLLRLGFKEEKNHLETYMLFVKEPMSLLLKEDGYSVALNYVTVYPLRKKVKYVHQLQNLYFAITGEELKPLDCGARGHC